MSIWLVCPQPKGNMNGWRERVNLDLEPCRSVKTAGIGGGSYYLEDDGMPRVEASDKPEYRVPLMSEVVKVRQTGLTVASTFSGCGGSSLGYRMAGFRVLYANEFVEAARDSYSANMSEGTVLDDRDVRTVTPQSVLKMCKLKKGELSLLDGSPPCSSFSTAGKRHKGWGEEHAYSDGKVQRTDDLFLEFARLVEGIQPRTFVAENVSGLVKGTAKGYFLEILARLKSCGYRIRCKVLDAQWLGVPQQRQRCIFVGVRNDLRLEPVHPSPLPFRYSVREAIPWIATSKDVASGGDYDKQTRKSKSTGEPAPTIIGTPQSRNTPLVCEGEVSEDTFGEHRTYTDKPAPSIRAKKQGHLIVSQPHVEPESNMSGYATGAEWDAMDKPGAVNQQSERYFQLVKPSLDVACPTVTAEGGNAGLASVCHPVERRKFSIAELRRICGFPDDFVLTGSYAAQWERLGRAVPPPMMFFVARAVRDGILLKLSGKRPWPHDLPFMKALLAYQP